jgi:hypothetical protein
LICGKEAIRLYQVDGPPVVLHHCLKHKLYALNQQRRPGKPLAKNCLSYHLLAIATKAALKHNPQAATQKVSEKDLSGMPVYVRSRVRLVKKYERLLACGKSAEATLLHNRCASVSAYRVALFEQGVTGLLKKKKGPKGPWKNKPAKEAK